MTTRGNEHPTLMTRLAAALHGEVAATTIEAYRRAGAAAYAEITAADAARAEMAASGADLWSIPVGGSGQLLCTWNAFALQTLGDELVEADYRADPRTVTAAGVPGFGYSTTARGSRVGGGVFQDHCGHLRAEKPPILPTVITPVP